MRNVDYNGPDQFKPLSPWGYVGYTLLFAIPIIGQIFLIVFTFSKKNLNRRSYARSYWCYLLLGLLVLGIVYLTGYQIITPNLPLEMAGMNRTQSRTIENSNSTYPSPSDETEHNGNEDDELVPEDADIMNDTASKTQSSAKSDGTEKTKDDEPLPTEKPKEDPAPSKVSAKFKKTMDGYEEFFDAYIAFMKKYEASNDDIGMVLELSSQMAKYVEIMSQMDEIDEDDLSAADAAYYLEVSARIYGKLAKASLYSSNIH